MTKQKIIAELRKILGPEDFVGMTDKFLLAQPKSWLADWLEYIQTQ